MQSRTKKSAYMFDFKKKVTPRETSSSDTKKEEFVIKHGSFYFEECPVPLLMEKYSNDINRMIDVVNWSEKTGNLPGKGGLLDQSNVFFEARKVIIGEQNLIEFEENEERTAKIERERQSNKNRRK